MKVIVVGGGIVGLCSAWALARAGHEPLLLEQGPLPNPGGASFDQHRLIRPIYGGEPGYCAMVDEAFGAWDLLWEELDESYYVEAGALALGFRPGDWTTRARATLDLLGLPYRVLDAGETAELCPFLALPDGVWGLWTARGGILLADAIVTALVRHLGGLGVALKPHCRVVGIDPVAGRVSLEGGGTESADLVVVVAGAWADKLVPAFAGRQRPVRQVVAYVEPPAAQAEAWGRSPAMVHLSPDVDLYCAPPLAGTGLKFGVGEHRTPSDPDTLAPLGEDEAAAVFAHARSQLRDFDGYRVLDGRVCTYSMAEDKRFLVEIRDRLVAVGGCSGHMFKFGALMGRRLAELADGSADPAGFAAWAAGRAPLG